MKPSEIIELLKEETPTLAKEIMRSDFVKTEPPTHSELLNDYLAFHYEMSGEIEGDIVLFIDRNESHGIVKTFLEATFGTYMELPGGVDGVCQEIANIFIGRYTGLICQKCLDIQIVGPGKTHQPGEVIKLLPHFGNGSVNLFAVSPSCGETKGTMTFWAEFRTID